VPETIQLRPCPVSANKTDEDCKPNQTSSLRGTGNTCSSRVSEEMNGSSILKQSSEPSIDVLKTPTDSTRGPHRSEGNGVTVLSSGNLGVQETGNNAIGHANMVPPASEKGEKIIIPFCHILMQLY